jgi:spore germination protein KC
MKQLTPPAIVELVGMSVFKGQKLLGYLSLDDTRNYLWTQNKLNLTDYSIPCGKNKFMTIRVFRSSSKTKASVQNGTPHFTIYINAETQLNEAQCKGDLNTIKTYDELEKKTEEFIENDVARTIKRTQKKYKVDIFGFGDYMKHGDYPYYKKVKAHWDQEFSRATFDVKATVTLRRSGIRTKGFLPEIK